MFPNDSEMFSYNSEMFPSAGNFLLQIPVPYILPQLKTCRVALKLPHQTDQQDTAPSPDVQSGNQRRKFCAAQRIYNAVLT